MDPNTPRPIMPQAQYPNRPVYPNRRTAVSASIFGGAVFDSSAGVAETPITPVIVQPGQSIPAPIMVTGQPGRPAPPPSQDQRMQVGRAVSIDVNQTTGATVFTGERSFQGQYGSSIFGGGISGMGDAALEMATRNIAAPVRHPHHRHRRVAPMHGLGAISWEKAPVKSDDTKHYCGFLNRRVTWDPAWPCDKASSDSALDAYLTWSVPKNLWGGPPNAPSGWQNLAQYNPNYKNYLALRAYYAKYDNSNTPPPHDGPGSQVPWIDAIRAGTAPVPAGLPMPIGWGNENMIYGVDPSKVPATVSTPAAAPTTTAAATPAYNPPLPPDAAMANANQLMATQSSSKNMVLFAALAGVAIVGGAILLSKKKKSAAAA